MSAFAVIRELSLQTGIAYYATVQAEDFTGKSSYAVSDAITIDTSEPAVEWVQLQRTSRFESGLQVEWSVVLDEESDIVSVEWGLGTRQGSSDVAGWEETSLERREVEIATRELALYQGQLIFATLKVL